MLENFQIRGYRCFSDFSISGLRRINLIAGKNAVGKSALLEAIRLYHEPSRRSLVDVLKDRDQAILGKSPLSLNTVAPLFFRIADSSQPKEARLIGDHGSVLVRAGWYRKDDDEWDDDPSGEAPDDPRLTPLLRMEFFDPFRRPRSIALDESQPIQHGRGLLNPDNFSVKTTSVPGSSLDTAGVVRLFEAIAGTDDELEASRFLKWIIPDAERLLTKGASDERMIYVKRQGSSGPEPLRTFGDGAFRLTALALALVNSREGCCLIDEIENGIHYELFDQIWEKLSLLAQALDVQIFATTHSKDCIEAFERSYRYPHFDACFHRLERDGDRIVAIRLDNESYFSVVAGQEHEIR